ncbi:hypothetical protein SAMN02745823_03776 [Sporobacter termitidis DSM 10068]|uniref:HTH cro/C1-type domain-containing protein n=1 Tax=Sporobacter termitidis DSM 10068 TaxID=1123282 RepID=A0A1M5ZI53_9FIRM|nr:hypothetical protein SAMN02745823_03776 [Sporobacter termitidis DSM 10068]
MEVIRIYELLRAEIAKQKNLQKKTNADLAGLTGFSKKTIEAFMCAARDSDSVANALAKALKIEQ